MAVLAQLFMCCMGLRKGLASIFLRVSRVHVSPVDRLAHCNVGRVQPILFFCSSGLGSVYTTSTGPARNGSLWSMIYRMRRCRKAIPCQRMQGCATGPFSCPRYLGERTREASCSGFGVRTCKPLNLRARARPDLMRLAVIFLSPTAASVSFRAFVCFASALCLLLCSK